MSEPAPTLAASSRQLWLRAGAPIFLLVLVTIAGALAIFWNLAKKQDHEFALDSQRLVASAMEGGTRALSNTTMDFAFWNDAYRAISLRWDQEWIDGNFFSAIADGIIVFREDGDVRYAWLAARDGEAADAAARVVARGAGTVLDLRQAASGVAAQDMVLNGFVLAEGQLLHVSTAPISWETEAERLGGRLPGPVDYVASIDIITVEEFAQMGEALGLSGLAFVQSASRANDTLVRLPVRDRAGTPLGYLTWRNERPGTKGFIGQVWPIAFGLLLVGAFAILITRHLVARQLEVLLRVEAALESSRVKSEFIATMSHELRTPLNAIIGYSELIEEELDADIARENAARQDAGRIRGAAGHFLRLVNEILAHARIDAGREPLDLCEVEASQVLAEVVDVITPLASANGNTLRVAAEIDDVRVMADPVRLTQCLVNLAGNAAKFTRNGTIEIRTRRIDKEGRAYVLFDVVDTGIGIDKAALERLFAPFTQADAAITREYGGAGLGLSITRKLARAMGGDVMVDSTPGIGSAFSIAVPAATETSLRLVA